MRKVRKGVVTKYIIKKQKVFSKCATRSNAKTDDTKGN